MTTLDNILAKPQQPAKKEQPTAQPAQQQAQAPTAASATQPTAAPQPVQQTPTAQPTQQNTPAATTAQTQTAPNMNNVLLSTVKTATDIDTAPITPQPEKPMTYTEMYQWFNPFTPMTAEELAEQRKKEKREQLFASIGDGISALSNLYFTTKGAPNAYDPSKSMSAKTKARWDKLRSDYDAQLKSYISGMMSAMQADANKDASYRDYLAKMYQNQIENNLKLAKEKRDQEMHDLNKKLADNKIKQGEYDAKIKEFESKYAEAEKKAELEAKRAAAAVSRERARKIRNGGGGGGSSSGYSKNVMKAADNKQLAYNYWQSLSENEKKAYRDMFNYYKMGKDEDDRPQKQYYRDTDSFVQQVWRNRIAYLVNNGRENEIYSGGYNLSRTKNLTRKSRGNKSKTKKSAI